MLLRLIAAVVLIAAVTGCGGSEDQAAPVVESVVETETPAGRPPAPDVMGTTLDGESISLGDFKGRPLLINVWSSW